MRVALVRNLRQLVDHALPVAVTSVERLKASDVGLEDDGLALGGHLEVLVVPPLPIVWVDDDAVSVRAGAPPGPRVRSPHRLAVVGGDGLVLLSRHSPGVKGYLPGHKAKGVDWCAAAPASASGEYYTYPSDRTVGTVTKDSNALTDVASTARVTTGEPVVDAAGAIASTSSSPAVVSGSGESTITLSAPASGTQASDDLTVEWTTSGLPEDVSFPDLGGAEGNGEWDCADYWTINHPHGQSALVVGIALGGVCGTPEQTTVSRYQVYRYEIAQGAGAGGIADWSGRNGWASNGRSDLQGATNPPGNFQTESGAPFCASANGVSGVDTTTGGIDRRNLIAPIINCLAQTALGNIAGAGASSETPVAAFGKFFMTQPYSALSDGYLYGEITGLVSSADKVKIFNLVQLYR